MTDQFGALPPVEPVPNPDAELRAADAQRPADYRNAQDRRAAGIDLRIVAVVVIVSVAAFLTVRWILAA